MCFRSDPLSLQSLVCAALRGGAGVAASVLSSLGVSEFAVCGASLMRRHSASRTERTERDAVRMQARGRIIDRNRWAGDCARMRVDWDH